MSEPTTHEPNTHEHSTREHSTHEPTTHGSSTHEPTIHGSSTHDPPSSDPTPPGPGGLALGDLDLRPPLRVARDATLRAVAGAMEDAGVSCVLVGTSPPWVVTEHDLAGALAAGMPADAPVEQVATRTPVWATPTSTLLDALGMMVKHGIRHLLVISAAGEPEGILGLPEATRLLLERT